jgi:hypothetical protein
VTATSRAEAEEFCGAANVEPTADRGRSVAFAPSETMSLSNPIR